MFDVVVIGGGPAGYVAAIRSSQLGLKTACIEEYTDSDSNPTFGGTCLNVGCIPSKALLDSSHRYHDATNHLKNHGIDIKNVELDLPAMMKRKDDIVKKLTGGIGGLFAANKVTPISGRGKVIAGQKVEVTNSSGDVEIIESKNIIIATGSSPIEIGSAKFDDKNILDSTGALEIDSVPKTLGVIGAGVIGLELGSVWARLGSKVTVIEAMDDFLFMADKEIAKETLKDFKKQGLDIRLGCKLTSSKSLKNSVNITYETEGKSEEMKFDKLIVAVGRKPNTKDVFSEDSGVSLDERGFINVNEHCQTNAENIWAVGDVVRGPMLAHKAEEEGIAVAEILAGQAGHVNYDVIPGVIYTSPEVATVGKTEEQLKEENKSYKIGKFPFLANSRAKVNNETEGFVKILADSKTDKVLGVHIIGPHCGDMIAEMALAMEFGASSEDIARTCHAHPTHTEAITEAALAVDKRPIHF